MKNTYLTFALVALLSTMLASSCVTQKKLTYFRGVETINADSLNRLRQDKPETTIEINDNLLISVSAVDEEAVAPFNLPVLTYATPGSTVANSTPVMQLYLVDTDGNIDFPIVGKLHLAGLTKSQAIQLITDTISSSVRDPRVNIISYSYSVTVLGEVHNPGKYSTSTERITILDAIGLAGDLTPYGKRDKVHVTREVNGKLEFGVVNLNTPDVFTSPYYYLRQHDVIYVEPNSVRAISSQNISLYLSMVTSLASMATVIVSVVQMSKK